MTGLRRRYKFLLQFPYGIILPKHHLRFRLPLADSSLGVLSCKNYALAKLGFPETTYQVSCRTIGLSLWETYAQLTGEPAQEGDEFVRLFIEHAEVVMADNTVLLDETPAAIQALKAKGYSWGSSRRSSDTASKPSSAVRTSCTPST
jgi:phosphoglycolate phosphatase-like HAD superfamily hydrolase